MSGSILDAERVLERVERVLCVPDKYTKHALERVERVLCVLERVERVPRVPERVLLPKYYPTSRRDCR